MKLVPALLLISLRLFAAEKPGFLVWNSDDLKGYEKTLHSRLGPDHTANLRLTDINGHAVFVVHRQATAPVEFHDTL